MLELNKLYNMDCMIGMARFPDKYFDLAIVDPPYGIGGGTRKTGGLSKRNSLTKFKKQNKDKGWDNLQPTIDYPNLLKKISKNQIIWGANHFNWGLYSECWIVWDKQTFAPSMSRYEIAYTSFSGHLIDVCINSNQLDRIHPTQKPIKLYKWLLNKFIKPDFKIIDTHAGSCSSVIAFLDYGCDWIAFEIDKDYYTAASKRIENHKMQLKLF